MKVTGRIVRCVSSRKKSLLFRRHYRAFQGGHLKVYDYFTHAQASEFYRPLIHIQPGGEEPHLWAGHRGVRRHYKPDQADCLFVAGLDWRALDDFPGIEERIPVINLVQGMRHADPDDPRFGYLQRKAIRICVGEQVKTAIEGTGQCNGPVHLIRNGIDWGLLPKREAAKPTRVLIAGLKQPTLAKRLSEKLVSQGFSVECLTMAVPRQAFLAKLAAASIVVTLPTPSEGFFLPPLEAMAMARVVICPDCIGNRSFCLDEETCLMPALDADALEASVVRVHADPRLAEHLSQAGERMSKAYDLELEREAFLNILASL